jgi:hypothetical protein
MAMFGALGLAGLIGLVDTALRTPDLPTWQRIAGMVLGPAVGGGCVWFGWTIRQAARARFGFMDLGERSLLLFDAGLFERPWEIPLEDVSGVLIDEKTERRVGPVNRFHVTPAADGSNEPASSWLYSSRGGSALPMLGGKQDPNVALLFERPMAFPGLRARDGRTVAYTEYGPSRASRPRPGISYPGVLLAVDEVDSLRRFAGERGLLQSELSASEAFRLGSTKANEDKRRGAFFTIATLMGILLLIQLKMLLDQFAR